MSTVAAAGSAGDSHSSHRRIAGATGIMMAAIFASRVLGLVREAVISYRFGQGFQSDVYVAAFMIPDLLFFLIAGGALSSAFIPVFTEKLTHGKEDEAWHVFSTVATVMFTVIIGFVILGEIFTNPLVHWTNFGFEAKKVAAATPLTRIVLPAQLCFFLGGLMMGAQYARHQFLIPSLGPVIYNLGIILGGLLLAKWFSIAGLCWGALFGALIGNFGLQLWALKRSGMQFKISFDWKHPDVMKVWKLMLPVVLGLALPQVSIMVNKMFASTLGNGPQSALTRANMLMQVPLGIFAQAMAVAIFPTLSILAAQQKFDELRRTASMGIRSLLFLTIPASFFMIVLAVPIIRLILQHGKFFPHDTFHAARALMFYSIGIFAWSVQSILARCFYALQDTRTPVIIGTVVTIFFIPLNYVLMKWNLPFIRGGVSGLALATSIAAILHMVVMMLVLRVRLHGIEGGRILTSIIKMTLAAMLAAFVAWLVRKFIPEASTEPHHVSILVVKMDALKRLAGALALGIPTYLFVAWMFHMEELHQAFALIRRRRPATQE